MKIEINNINDVNGMDGFSVCPFLGSFVRIYICNFRDDDYGKS